MLLSLNKIPNHLTCTRVLTIKSFHLSHPRAILSSAVEQLHHNNVLSSTSHDLQTRYFPNTLNNHFLFVALGIQTIISTHRAALMSRVYENLNLNFITP